MSPTTLPTTMLLPEPVRLVLGVVGLGCALADVWWVSGAICSFFSLEGAWYVWRLMRALGGSSR